MPKEKKELSQVEISKAVKKECGNLRGSALAKCSIKIAKKLKAESIMKGE